MNKDELEQLMIPSIDETIYMQVKQRCDRLLKPLDGLGRFEHFFAQIGAILQTTSFSLSQKRILVMCADNGIVEEGVSQSGKEVTRTVAKAMGENQSSVGKMASVIGVKVCPIDVGIDCSDTLDGVLNCKVSRGTCNFLKEPAMTEEETMQAISVGIQQVRECKNSGCTLIGTGEMGIGNTTTSTAVAAALLDLDVYAVTGRGAGLDDASLAKKAHVIAQAIDKYNLLEKDAFTILQTVGGLDIAALTGVFIGGALYRLPVIIDGVISAVAALVAEKLCKGVKAYMLPSHKSREKLFTEVMKELAIEPVIDADMALGEGTGVVMMMSLLDMAMAVYQNGSTFEEQEMEQYKRYY